MATKTHRSPLVTICTGPEQTYLVLDVQWGTDRQKAANQAQDLANMFGHECRYEFNGDEFVVKPGA